MAETQRSSFLPAIAPTRSSLSTDTPPLPCDLLLARSQSIISALPRERYRSALLIDQRPSDLTQLLALRCDRLLSVQTAESVAAPLPCQKWTHVRCQHVRVPLEYPIETFDLTLVADVGHHWNRTELLLAQRRIVKHLAPNAHLLLVHWRAAPSAEQLHADLIHDAMGRSADLRHTKLVEDAHYRIDLFERVS